MASPADADDADEIGGRARMLTRTAIAEATLTEEESQELRRLAAEIQADAYTDDAVLARSLACVPGRLRSLVAGFGDRLGMAGIVRLRGLPLPANLPPTPDSPDAGLCARSGAETLLLGFATLAGSVVGFAWWRSGQRVHNVSPFPEHANSQKASNAVRLDMHTEAAFIPGCPEALALLCLRNGGDQAPATAFCDLHTIWEGLSAHEQALLTEPAFFTAGPDENGNEVRSEAVAVAYPAGDASADRKGCRFHYIPALRGATPEHEDVLRRFSADIGSITSEVTMAPGDLVLIDNTHVVHGRTPFTPRFDGTDRWLQRCLIRQREAASVSALRPLSADQP
jgi:L-asparagine oxygenase